MAKSVDDLLAEMNARSTVLLKLTNAVVRLRNPPRAPGQTYVEWDDARTKEWPLDDVVPAALVGKHSADAIDKASALGTIADQTSDAWGLMTKDQRKAIMSLVRGIMDRDGMQRDDVEFPVDYEFKSLEIVHRGRERRGGRGVVWLYTTVGRVGDEGTMAEVFCRTVRTICVTPRGAVTLWNRARWVGKSGDEKNPLRKTKAANGRGLWSAIHDPTN